MLYVPNLVPRSPTAKGKGVIEIWVRDYYVPFRKSAVVWWLAWYIRISPFSETQGQIVGARERLNGRKVSLSLAPTICLWVSEDGISRSWVQILPLFISIYFLSN